MTNWSKMRRLKILLALILILMTGILNAQDKIYFVIRVDDIQSRNTTMVPRRITDFETMAENHRALVTWAVIPHRLIESQNNDGILTDDLIASAAKGHEIAMHGYNHICPTCSQSSHEMICTTYGISHSPAIQSGLISDGLKILSDSLGLKPASFVPPGHYADTTSYSALAQNGFPWISTTGSAPGLIYPNLPNLPPHNEYTWYLSNDNYQARLQDALRDIREKTARDGYYCLLLHDPFIRLGYENGLVINWVNVLLDSVEAEFGESLVYATISQTAEQILGTPSGLESEKPGRVPEMITLSTYPNPFNNQIRFDYNLPEAAQFKLGIFDVLGREITTLADQWQAAGGHSLKWSAADQASGMYYYRIQYNGTSLSDILTGRIILIK